MVVLKVPLHHDVHLYRREISDRGLRSAGGRAKRHRCQRGGGQDQRGTEFSQSEVADEPHGTTSLSERPHAGGRFRLSSLDDGYTVRPRHGPAIDAVAYIFAGARRFFTHPWAAPSVSAAGPAEGGGKTDPPALQGNHHGGVTATHFQGIQHALPLGSDRVLGNAQPGRERGGVGRARVGGFLQQPQQRG